MHQREARDAHAPRFFLASAPAADGRALLLEAEQQHALRVLRLQPGAAVVGLDGQGGSWPLILERVDKRGADWRQNGPPTQAPEPGSSGSPLAWIGVAVAWPKAEHAESMLDRLVQLGAMAILPLETRQAGPQARQLHTQFAAGHKRQRLERIAREACKQSRRSWLPRLEAPAHPSELPARLAGASLVLLEPGASEALCELAPQLLARPVWVCVGPEGGFHPDERAALQLAGAQPACLAPHILRIETAAEAALAVLQCAALRSHKPAG